MPITAVMVRQASFVKLRTGSTNGLLGSEHPEPIEVHELSMAISPSTRGQQTGNPTGIYLLIPKILTDFLYRGLANFNAMWLNAYLIVYNYSNNQMEENTATKVEQPSYGWMPLAAGILCILSGIVGIIATAFVITVGIAFGAEIAAEVMSSFGVWNIGIPLTVIWLVAIPLLVVSLLSIIGGSFAINKKNWVLALIGAVFAIIPTQIIGIVALILIVISKKEFN